MFGLLARTGSNFGWAIPLHRSSKADDGCLKHSLDHDAADWLAHEHLPYEPTILLDDRVHFALLTLHTDEAYLCLTPELFARYLDENPTNYDLFGDGSAVSGFKEALDQAFRRLDSWRRMEDESSQKHGSKLLSALPEHIHRLRFQRFDAFD